MGSLLSLCLVIQVRLLRKILGFFLATPCVFFLYLIKKKKIGTSCSILIYYYSISFFLISLDHRVDIYFVILVKVWLNRLKSHTMIDYSLGICLSFVSLIFISLACQLGYHPVDIILIRVVLAAIIILVIYVLFKDKIKRYMQKNLTVILYFI